LIGLDKITANDDKLLYGLVTTGAEWNFFLLDRKNKIIIQDKNSLYLIQNLEAIFQIMISILESTTLVPPTS